MWPLSFLLGLPFEESYNRMIYKRICDRVLRSIINGKSYKLSQLRCNSLNMRVLRAYREGLDVR